MLIINIRLEVGFLAFSLMIIHLLLKQTKQIKPSFKLLARKLRYFAINRYFCELKTRML